LIVALLFIVVAWPIAIIGLITGIPKLNLDRKMIKMYPSGWVVTSRASGTRTPARTYRRWARRSPSPLADHHQLGGPNCTADTLRARRKETDDQDHQVGLAAAALALTAGGNAPGLG
jgi:hypothetical protein